jgi:hypothetical protein
MSQTPFGSEGGRRGLGFQPPSGMRESVVPISGTRAAHHRDRPNSSRKSMLPRSSLAPAQRGLSAVFGRTTRGNMLSGGMHTPPRFSLVPQQARMGAGPQHLGQNGRRRVSSYTLYSSISFLEHPRAGSFWKNASVWQLTSGCSDPESCD